MRVAFVIQHGEARYGFFDDTLLSLLCADARQEGHDADVVQVFFHGRSLERDAAVRTQLKTWLQQHSIQLVVVERAVDPASLSDFAQEPGAKLLQVTRGDSLDPVLGTNFILGALPGLTSEGRTARTPPIADLRHSFRAFLRALSSNASMEAVPGLVRIEGDQLLPGAPIKTSSRAWSFAPVLEHQVIAQDPPPPVTHKTVFGNVGCPYSRDPYSLPHYLAAEAPSRVGLSRLGCAFCPMGGDYQVRPDSDVVEDIVGQAQYFASELSHLEALVISDQSPVRYLAELMRAAGRSQLRELRWLFPCRADAFIRDAATLPAALSAARTADQVLECYLVGFESFCQRELDRYNKGVTVDELVQSVAAMRELKAQFPDSFEYAQARGHSLVLFNPWTSPADVLESASVIREHGLAELFDELTRNRLRLYSDLPITYAAKRDGALDVAGNIGSGAGRRKGYSEEVPWRFLDGRTHRLADLSDLLRDRLGTETELSQLLAAATFVSEPNLPSVTEFESSLDGLIQSAEDLLHDERRPAGLSRARTQRANSVLLAGACNNGCASCPNRDSFLDDDEDVVLRRVASARRESGPILFAGREPSLHPALLRLVQRAHGKDERLVGIVSNGRRFSYAAFAVASVRSGLGAASVKIFGPTAEASDAITRAPGAHSQALEGLRRLLGLGVALEIRAPLHRANLESFDAYAELGAAFHASLRVEVSLEAVGLANLEDSGSAIGRLASACIARGVALELAPISLGSRDFRYVPTLV